MSRAAELLALMVGGMGCAASQAGEGTQLSFDRVEVGVGTTSRALVASDVDGDGRPDLIAAGGDSVFVLRGRGDGRFDLLSSVAAGENPVDLAAADLDGDGRLDLAAANHDMSYVTLLFGVTGGGFERRAHSELAVDVAPHPHAVRLHDVDGDGRPDLLVDDRTPGAIRAFHGDGDGTFSEPRRIGVGGDPYRGMALADLDGDGRVDLVTPNPDHVSVLLGDGSGGFARHAALPTGFNPFTVVVADVDGNGMADLVAGSGEGTGVLAVWSGTAEGAFAPAGRYDIARGPTRSAAADLTGDGRSEVLMSSYAGGEVAVLLGGEPPTLLRLQVDGAPYGLATGDFDMDGRTDFAVANDTRERISVFLSRWKDRGS